MSDGYPALGRSPLALLWLRRRARGTAKGHSRRRGRTPTFRISERLTVLRPPVARGTQLDRDKYHCQSWLYTAGKKIIFFSREPTAFSKILERSFVRPNEPVNVCKFQSSTFSGFLGVANFSKYADPALGGRLLARLWPRAEAPQQRRLSYTRPVAERKLGRAALPARRR